MEQWEEVISESEEETIDFGRRLAEELQPGDVVALQGQLGSGKTYMVKGIAAAFGIAEESVHSPTFSLIHEYHGDINLYHFDCYRMESAQEALEIGAESYLYSQGICVIEWPERIRSILPAETIWVKLKNIGPGKRQFNIKKKVR